MKYVIGKGVLTWGKVERVSDRYGSVFLLKDGGNSWNSVGTVPLDLKRDLIGKLGTLKARVLETRQSTHVGDLFRGFRPSTPEPGVTLVLGTGRLFHRGEGEDNTSVGVLPLDGRQTDWLDPKVLYQAHEQTVELYFETEGGEIVTDDPYRASRSRVDL